MEESNAKTSITLSDRYGTYHVECNEQDMALGDVIEKLIIPILHAARYPTHSVEGISLET